jgi:hypothetical protein
MKNPPTYKNKPVKRHSGGDLDPYIVQLLPTHLDIAKAIVVVATLAACARVAPRCRNFWASHIEKHESSPQSSTGSVDSFAGSAHDSAHQTKDRTEGTEQEVGELTDNQPSIAVSVEFVVTANSPPSPFVARESPEKQRRATQTSTAVRTPPRDVLSIVYFDNAGRSYASKAARDAAEDHQLAASLRWFPAMKPEQRAIMRARAFVRLASLDRQHHVNPRP